MAMKWQLSCPRRLPQHRVSLLTCRAVYWPGQAKQEQTAHLHDSDARRAANGRQAVRNDDGGAALHAL